MLSMHGDDLMGAVCADISTTPIVIQVDRSLSPRGADRFYELLKDHFYDNSALFRVVPGFVLQVNAYICRKFVSISFSL